MEHSPASKRLAHHRERRIEFIDNADLINFGGYTYHYVPGGPKRLDYLAYSICEMLGYTQDEVAGDLGDDYSRLVFPRDLLRYESHVAAIAEEGGTDIVEYTMVGSRGELYVVSDRVKAVKGEDGVKIYGTVENVTALRRNEDKLMQLNRRLMALHEESPFGIVEMEIGAFPTLTYFNSAALRIIGMEGSYAEHGERFVGQNVRVAILDDDLGVFSDALDRSLESAEPVPFELRLVRRNGAPAPVRVLGWMKGECDEEGGLPTVRASFFDVTDVFRAEMRSRVDFCIGALAGSFDYMMIVDLYLERAQGVYGKLLPWDDENTYYTMPLASVLERWIGEAVIPADRDTVRAFVLQASRRGKAGASQEQAIYVDSIRFSMLARGEEHRGEILVIGLGDGMQLMCFRDVTAIERAAYYRRSHDVLLRGVSRMGDLIDLVASGVVEYEELGGGYEQAQPVSVDAATSASPAAPNLTPEGAIAEDPADVEAMLQAGFGGGVIFSEVE